MATSEQLTHLLQLGFDETESIAALKKNNNNANSAAEYLLAKKNTSPQSQQITHTEEIILNGLYKCMECDLFFETLDNSIAHGEESSHATFQKPILKVNIDLNQQTLNEIEKIKTASVEKINQDNPNGSLASRIAELDRIYASKGGESNRRYHNRREQAMLAARQAENKALQKGSSVEEARQEYERALKSKMSLNPPVENWLASKSFEDRIDALLDGAQAMVESRKMDKDDLKKMLDLHEILKRNFKHLGKSLIKKKTSDFHFELYSGKLPPLERGQGATGKSPLASSGQMVRKKLERRNAFSSNQNGLNLFDYADHDIFNLELKENIYRENMQFTFPDGSVYIGGIRDELPNGRGSLSYTAIKDDQGNKVLETIFTGEFKNGVKHGKGCTVTKIHCLDKVIHEELKGEYFKGNLISKADVEVVKENHLLYKYIGSLSKGSFSDQGCFQTNSGLKFNGFFYKDRVVGNGVLNVPASVSYTGKNYKVDAGFLGLKSAPRKKHERPKLKSKLHFGDFVGSFRKIQLGEIQKKKNERAQLNRVKEKMDLDAWVKRVREKVKRDREKKLNVERDERLELARMKREKVAKLRAQKRRIREDSKQSS
eukprot:augustus_masked-scaffold_1-processed-gene-20.4-mRNA-1 protein AED:1.00 eAED:1.00 QI:0/0/0/0/1/1/2/0/600